ncbi:MAG: GntR family transcriptional regulator [Dermatophilus congolensis]|nr:GntR family transcriptional regulator [Dermatophilus congolensis]
MTTERSAAEQLRRVLLEEIDAGELSVGSRLGGERELAARYGVSRGTLRAVLGTLEEAGLVRRVPGRGGGTFVSRPKVERDLGGIEGVPGFLASQGYRAGSRVICTHMTTPPDRVRAALGLAPGELIYFIQRIRLADGRPISIDHGYFPAERFPGLLDLPLGGSVYELLKDEYDTEPHEAEERIEVAQATDEEAALLSIAPEAPLILVRRLTYDADGHPFEYSKDLFRADRTSIRMRTAGRGIRREIVDDGGVELWGSSELASE